MGLAGTGLSGALTNRQRTLGMVMRQIGPPPSLRRRTNCGIGRRLNGSLARQNRATRTCNAGGIRAVLGHAQAQSPRRAGEDSFTGDRIVRRVTLHWQGLKTAGCGPPPYPEQQRPQLPRPPILERLLLPTSRAASPSPGTVLLGLAARTEDGAAGRPGPTWPLQVTHPSVAAEHPGVALPPSCTSCTCAAHSTNCAGRCSTMTRHCIRSLPCSCSGGLCPRAKRDPRALSDGLSDGADCELIGVFAGSPCASKGGVHEHGVWTWLLRSARPTSKPGKAN